MIDYTYDKDGRRLSMTVAGQPVVNYVYDASGRMTSISTKIGSSSRAYTLTYDNAAISIDRYLSGQNLRLARDIQLKAIEEPQKGKYDRTARAQMPYLERALAGRIRHHR